MPLSYAIYVGVFLSLALYLRHAGKLRAVEIIAREDGRFLERELDEESLSRPLLVVQLSGDLFFGVADDLADQLADVVRGGPAVVVLRLKRTHLVDATVLEVLSRFVADMHAADRHVVVCGVRPVVMRPLQGYGLVEQVGPDNVFASRPSLLESTRRAMEHGEELLAARPGA
ncbi:MAG: SulP family inorganic anion transporter [Sandaracinaceae bacterium]|nr:SulP family inorganic anion transporter [Sandaracinaceae bacterium]